MKIGDLVTWKQREDLKEAPIPYRRLGFVGAIEEEGLKEVSPRCEVYWYQSGNKVWWAIDALELA